MIFVFGIPLYIIAIFAFALFALGYLAVAMVMEFIIKFFWIISIFIWLCIFWISKQTLRDNGFTIKSVTDKIYVFSAMFCFSIFYIFLYICVHSIYEYLIEDHIFEVIIGLIGSYFILTFSLVLPVLVIDFFQNHFWKKGKKKTAIFLNFAVTIFVLLVLFVPHLDELPIV